MEPSSTKTSRMTDSGSSWIVAVFSCIALAMHFGVINCGALFYPGLVELTDMPVSALSWFVTGQYGMTFCFAPLYNRLHRYLHFRIIIVGAALLTTASFISASYVHSFAAFFILYTVFGGIGLGTSVVRIVGIAAERFDRYRILALALCTCGAGLGTFIYSNLGGYMIEELTWRVALMGYALFHLNLIPVSLLLRRLPPEDVTEPAIIMPDQAESSIQSRDLIEASRMVTFPDIFSSRLSVYGSGGLAAQKGVTYPQRLNESNRRITAARKLRACVEFAKCHRVAETKDFHIDPLFFAPDPGASVMDRIKETCREYITQLNNAMCNTVFVPVLFIVGELDAALTLLLNTNQEGILTEQELNDLLISHFELILNPEGENQESDSKTHVKPFVGDSISASVIIAQERKRARGIVRATVRKAETRAYELCETLSRNGLDVSPTPIIVLVEHSGDLMYSRLFQIHSCDRMHKISNAGFEEVEETDKSEGQQQLNITSSERNLQPTMPIGSSTLSLSNFLSMGSQYLTNSHSKVLDHFITRETNEFAKNHRLSCFILQSTDLLNSASSVYDVQKAGNHLMTITGDRTPVQVCTTHDQKYGSVLRNPLFFSLLVTRLLVYVADSIIFAHLSYFALKSGLSEDDAASLLSSIGIASMFSRLGTGLIGQFAPRCDSRTMTSCCLLVLAIHTIVMPLYPTYMALLAFTIVYGVLLSPSSAFTPVMAYEITGPARYDEAVSYWFQFEAIGYLLGGPLGGLVKEINNNYMDCFALAGTCDLVAALIIFIQGLILTRCAERIAELFRTTCCSRRHGTG
ncbi:transporter, major facilitator family protein [Opisthorchis viverrini]|uniref:Transporter, major facilitator family protein n=1 Tax=Opisthorchis viverrini TaxID=6198 RepID=A0A1S8WTB4_OPIVI|nr:transporter, major facilitator family protein [Opisthorchis viverrini]